MLASGSCASGSNTIRRSKSISKRVRPQAPTSGLNAFSVTVADSLNAGPSVARFPPAITDDGRIGTVAMTGAALDLGHARRRSALERALGPAIADALARADVVEAIVNADGRVWLDVVGQGLIETPIHLAITRSRSRDSAAWRAKPVKRWAKIGQFSPLCCRVRWRACRR